MYDFVYIIDFGNTSKTYYSCLSLNCSPMINSVTFFHVTVANVTGQNKIGINGNYNSFSVYLNTRQEFLK